MDNILYYELETVYGPLYIESDKQIEEKRMSVHIIFELNSFQKANNQIIYEDPPMTQEEKDHVASKILAKYLL